MQIHDEGALQLRRRSERWNTLLNAVGGSHLLNQPQRRRLYRLGGIELGQDTTIHAGQVFRPGPISIGSDCFINYGCQWDPGEAGIFLADSVSVSIGVDFAAVGHDFGPSERRGGPCTYAPIVVERGAAIGAHVVILSGVTIGAGSFVGAGSVVTRDVEPDSVYTGAPARWRRDLPPGAQPARALESA